MILGGSDSPGSPQDNLEVWNPGTKEGCILNKKFVRTGAPICGNLICGGNGENNLDDQHTCLLFNPKSGEFRKTNVELKIPRYQHMCWETERGILLMGGGRDMNYDKSLTELVSLDGSYSEPSFNLEYGGWIVGCGVDLEDGRFVVIGQKHCIHYSKFSRGRKIFY